MEVPGVVGVMGALLDKTERSEWCQKARAGEAR